MLDRKKKRCGSVSLDMHPVTSNTTDAEECDLLPFIRRFTRAQIKTWCRVCTHRRSKRPGLASSTFHCAFFKAAAPLKGDFFFSHRGIFKHEPALLLHLLKRWMRKGRATQTQEPRIRRTTESCFKFLCQAHLCSVPVTDQCAAFMRLCVPQHVPHPARPWIHPRGVC